MLDVRNVRERMDDIRDSLDAQRYLRSSIRAARSAMIVALMRQWGGSYTTMKSSATIAE